MDIQELLRQAVPLHQAGRFEEAEQIYARILADQPGFFQALHLMGLLRLQQNRHHEAQLFMEAALRAQPGAPETLCNYAILLSHLGRNEEALTALDQSLAAQPGNARSITNRGAIKSKLGRLEEALEDFDRALAIDRHNGEALNNRGLMLHGLGRYEDALASFDLLLTLMPDSFETRNNRGLTLRELSRNSEALAEFDRVIAQAPHHAGAHVNRASMLWRAERLDEALEAYAQALALNPKLPEALESRSSLLWTRQRALAPAIADLEALMALDPARPYAMGNLLHLKMHAGDWRDFAAGKAQLDDAVRAGKPAVEPFVYQGLSESPADILSCAMTYAAREFPARVPGARAGGRRPGPIRLGYVCGEFRAQATMYLAAGLFESHDRKRFQVSGFDNGRDDGSALRKRVIAGFDKFISIADLSDRDAAQRIAGEGIDILVNLNGYFGKMRPGIFAQRPAPIQVNYLGFPGTLGAAYMDYILGDSVVFADGDDTFFSEKLVRLPGSYQINDSERAPVTVTTRAAHDLPEGGFVFCHFNYGYKIMPDLFACWMRILKSVPGSLLWLLAGNPLFAKNLSAEAERAGIDPARLVFAPPLDVEPHRARLALADLFLDSTVSNAHTTASDALWAGLPLLTCKGHAFSGRVAASLLNAVGLPELVTHSLEDYEMLAVKLAREPALRGRYRGRLVETRHSAPLFDTARTVRHIEAAFEKMQALKQNGEAAISFAVPQS